jgi:hypothetical protein
MPPLPASAERRYRAQLPTQIAPPFLVRAVWMDR